MINTINNYIMEKKSNCPFKYDTINNFEENLLENINDYLIDLLIV